ncbi:MAG: alcohol dehydrogenase catalytic domain-containing protein, partial [Proteobacteria bacterium]|nr:alcohol dehydrogenase catalytic domain-containing protein [Pseudomonadota bacterium]
MRAMVLDAPGQVALRDVGRPQPGPGETLIRVTHSGICGTDLKIFQGGIPVAYPKIMGHESVGEVVSGGDLKPGTLVIVDPATYCG